MQNVKSEMSGGEGSTWLEKNERLVGSWLIKKG